MWQSSQVLLLWMCPAPLPVAEVPLWQLTQLPVTEEWSNCTFVQEPPAVWQSSQVLPLGRCPAPLPVAEVPLWQLKQPVTTPA